ncbi:MAG: NADH-quinone oxidoreductase subunit N [Anaerolineae bacterium]|jgi:NADH-quinone oxidoreductase subunit N|nr:NADH-quinone oxidoreductase subunit N [Anaerolineae bacterium]
MFETPTLDTLIGYNLNVALPAIALALGTMILLLVDLFLPDERKHWTPILALAGLSASFVMTLFNLNPAETEAFGGMFVADGFTGFLNMVVLATAFLTVLLSTDYLRRTNTQHGEYYTLLLMSTTGTMFMIGANDLVVIFVALELLSIPLYVLAAFRVTDGTRQAWVLRSEESGIKYFILGAFSSAFFVYGAALLYGATGTTNLEGIFAAVQAIVAGSDASAKFLLLAGTALALVGLGFKVAVVPFHTWTPDVYEGAPTPVTAFMSVAAKIGGFASLMRLMVVGLSVLTLAQGLPAAWQQVVQVIAALTLILGNLVAVAQTSVKRLLAYSSIAHAGYLMMAVAAVGSEAFVPGVANAAAQGMLVYLLAYMFTNMGAFAVVTALEKDDGTGVNLDDFIGLYNTRPGLAVAMGIFALSLIGIPLTGGFMGKWLVFGATVQAGLIPLAVIGVLTSVISAFYYVRLIVNMFLLGDKDSGNAAVGGSLPVRATVYASLAGVLVVGIAVPLVTGLVNLVRLI